MPIDTQKQVPPASPQLTATMKTRLAAGLVGRVDVAPAQEDAVVHGDRVQVARADADEGDRLGVLRLVDELELGLAVPARANSVSVGGWRKRFHDCGPDGVAEERVVVAPRQPVGACLLLVRPPGGQVGGRADLVVDDRPVRERGAEQQVAALDQRLEEAVQPGRSSTFTPAAWRECTVLASHDGRGATFAFDRGRSPGLP